MSGPDSGNSGLDVFNALSEAEAADAVASCCPWPDWAAGVVAGRPYGSEQEAQDAAGQATQAIPDANLPEVLSRFPPIAVDRGGDSRAASWSRQEESAIHSSAEAVKDELVSTGLKYRDRFGYTFVIAATGRSSAEVLKAMKERLEADPARELRTSREQVDLITRMRMAKLLAQLDPGPGL